MVTRTAIALLLVVATGMYTQGARGAEQPPSRIAFSAVPLSIGQWEGYEARPFADDVVAQLGADDYVNRVYVSGAELPVSLFAGYYASQRQGDTIHSPQNCLPGAGWQPISSDRTHLDGPTNRFEVNRVVIQKGIDRQAVLYWYQGRGRIVANEFANKGWLMVDAVRLRRTDGGLVRLITRVNRTPEEAFARLAAFSSAIMPTLWEHIP